MVPGLFFVFRGAYFGDRVASRRQRQLLFHLIDVRVILNVLRIVVSSSLAASLDAAQFKRIRDC